MSETRVRRRPGITMAHKVPPPTGDYRWVYLWEWPLRAMHWTAAACVVLLVVTGLYIGKPYFMTGGEASAHFLMGWVRFLHFASAAVLVMTGIVRVYWLFMGNRYERIGRPLPDPSPRLGQPVPHDQVLPDDPAGEGAPLPRP